MSSMWNCPRCTKAYGFPVELSIRGGEDVGDCKHCGTAWSGQDLYHRAKADDNPASQATVTLPLQAPNTVTLKNTLEQRANGHLYCGGVRLTGSTLAPGPVTLVGNVGYVKAEATTDATGKSFEDSMRTLKAPEVTKPTSIAALAEKCRERVSAATASVFDYRASSYAGMLKETYGATAEQAKAHPPMTGGVRLSAERPTFKVGDRVRWDFSGSLFRRHEPVLGVVSKVVDGLPYEMLSDDGCLYDVTVCFDALTKVDWTSADRDKMAIAEPDAAGRQPVVKVVSAHPLHKFTVCIGPLNQLDVEYDGTKLRTLVELDARARQENIIAQVKRKHFTPAQKAALSAHLSAVLRAKVEAKRKDDQAAAVSVYVDNGES